jgi:TonB family protein
LAQRRLLTSTELPTWESNELAGSSAVQVLVDAAGRVISAVLLASSTGAKQPDADAHALALAQAARFESITDETPMLGTLLFDWQLLPLPATNAPAALP